MSSIPTIKRTSLPTLLDPDELDSWLRAQGEPPMRAKQIRSWIFAKRADSFSQMTDLPVALRQRLAEAFVVFSSQIEHHAAATDGTHKLALRLHDGELIECVLIQDIGRHTACISTQVGCGMGCVFCASGLNGVTRNLTASEILEQLVRMRNLLPATERLDHIVVMGMGEPLANLDSLIEALAVAGARDGLGIGARHVTISTVGLPAKIRVLADLGKCTTWPSRCMLRTTCARRSCRRTTRPRLAEILEAADYFFAHRPASDL